MFNRNRNYYRQQRKRVIKRKVNILRKIGGEYYVNAWSGGVLGRFAKGKIHCSCRMCRCKSCDELTVRDKRKTIDALDQLSEY